MQSASTAVVSTNKEVCSVMKEKSISLEGKAGQAS
jgi:hypothetical protein